MKRFVIKLLAVIITAACILPLYACGEKLPDGKTVKITIGMWPPNTSPAEVAQFEQWTEAFNEEYPEVLVVPDPYNYSPDTFSIRAESGKTPTIFKTWFTEPEKLISNGYVKDLTFIYEEKGWTDALVPEVKNILSKNDKIYGIPCDGYALGLYVNMEHMRNAGLTETVEIAGEYGTKTAEVPLYPTRLYNPDDPYDLTTLTGVAIKLKESNEGIPGLMILSDDKVGGWQFNNFVWSFGGQLQVYDEAAGKYKANLNSPEAVTALQWIKDLKHTYKVLPNATSLAYNAWAEYYGSGRVSMVFAGNDAYEIPIKSYGMNRNKISLVPFPAGPGGQYALYGGTPFMISSHASDAQARAAIEFLRYMGRHPVDDEITRWSYKTGFHRLITSGLPVLPRIPVWQDETFRNVHKEEMAPYLDEVEYARYSDFFEVTETILRKEEMYYCQEMYALLDIAIQDVLNNANANCAALLKTANDAFQKNYMSKI